MGLEARPPWIPTFVGKDGARESFSLLNPSPRYFSDHPRLLYFYRRQVGPEIFPDLQSNFLDKHNSSSSRVLTTEFSLL